jgi:hypothetical protein
MILPMNFPEEHKGSIEVQRPVGGVKKKGKLTGVNISVSPTTLS